MSGVALVSPHRVVDDFLNEGLADGLLAQILAAAEHFAPARIGLGDEAVLKPEYRSSLRLPGRKGVDLEPFRAVVHARAEELCKGAGIQPFDVHHTECSIVAHGDGDFYRTHIDTQTGPRDAIGHVRMLSCVYYLHRRPAGFSGGALALHPFGGAREGAPSTLIEPVHNRLAAFPAFVRHEVLPVASPSGDFADRRFSINCWLHRKVSA